MRRVLSPHGAGGARPAGGQVSADRLLGHVVGQAGAARAGRGRGASGVGGKRVSPGAPPLPLSCGQRAQGCRLSRPRAPTRQRDFQTPSADAGFTSPSRVASGFWGSPKRSRGSGRPCPLSSAHAQRPATRQGARGVLGTGRSRAAGTHPAWWMWTPLLVGLAGADWVSEDAVRMRWGRAFTVAWKGRGTRDVDARLALGHGADRRCR